MTQRDETDLTRIAAVPAGPPPDTREGLSEMYERIAAGHLAKAPVCCGSADGSDAVDATYAGTDTRRVPSSARNLSLACGNPVALAMIRSGQTVLDLGSGGGFDCFLAAREVGDAGFVIGVDMTPGMVERARAAQREMGVRNVDFRLGEIEHLPVADGTVDVVLSNCVVNLAPDKAQVFREAYRALKAGGVLIVSDMMIGAPLPEALRVSLDSLSVTVCVEGEYLAAIEAAGFVDVAVIRRVSPRLPQDEVDGVRAEAPRRARAIVRVGETGESRTIDLDPASLEAPSTRSLASFSATVRARKPL